MTWLQMRSGVVCDLSDLDQLEISPVDVAWSLAHLCRFNGHCRRFYSVAEHSFRMLCVPGRIGVLNSQGIDEVRLQAYILCHDAHEAVMGDIPRPLKQALGKSLIEFEGKVRAAVLRSLGLDPNHDAWEVVKRCDNVMLLAEARELMTWPPEDWELGLSPRDQDAARFDFLSEGCASKTPGEWAACWVQLYKHAMRKMREAGAR